jgi:tRNA threonylcarbamoyladenosine biosynthesis protein TsaB
VIAALEAASSALSLGLVTRDGEPLADAGWTSRRGGAHDLLPRLLDLLAGRGHELRDVSAVGVGTGPGSFTGLRVAMALAKGLAVGLRVPCVGVPTLPAWLDAEPAAEAAATRAGASEAHLLLRGEPEPRVVTADELSSALAGRPLVAPTELAEAWGLAHALPPLRAATAIGRSTAARLRAEPAGDLVAELEPLYVRPPRGVGALGAARSR